MKIIQILPLHIFFHLSSYSNNSYKSLTSETDKLHQISLSAQLLNRRAINPSFFRLQIFNHFLLYVPHFPFLRAKANHRFTLPFFLSSSTFLVYILSNDANKSRSHRFAIGLCHKVVATVGIKEEDSEKTGKEISLSHRFLISFFLTSSPSSSSSTKFFRFILILPFSNSNCQWWVACQLSPFPLSFPEVFVRKAIPRKE